MLEMILTETVKSTLKDAAKKQTGEIRRNFMAKVAEDPDRIQPWNPLSHLVDGREKLCARFTFRNTCCCDHHSTKPKVSTAVPRFGPAGAWRLCQTRPSDEPSLQWQLLKPGFWRMACQERLKKSSPQRLQRGGDRGHYSFSYVGNTG